MIKLQALLRPQISPPKQPITIYIWP